MSARRPLVNIGGSLRELPVGDSLVSTREVLTAARTYYVRTDGSDSNTGLTNSAAGAFLTIQRAIDVASAFDLNNNTVTIQVGNGTYTGNITCKGFVGGGLILVRGDPSTPSNVVLTASGGGIVTMLDVGVVYQFTGFRVQGSSAIGFIANGTGCKIIADHIEYGALIYAAYAYFGGNVDIGVCSIVGNMNAFALSIGQARLTVQVGITITLVGTPNFSEDFIQADRMSLIQIYGITFSGSATGKRYTIDGLSEVFVNGAGTSYLPGNAAGTVTNGLYA